VPPFGDERSKVVYDEEEGDTVVFEIILQEM
jgi:hypothetical protein